MNPEGQRRRIVVVSWYPADAPNSGERVRLHHLCRALAESFDVHVISFAPEETGPAHPWTDHRASGRLVKPYGYGLLDKALAALRRVSVHEVVLAGAARRRFVAQVLDELAPVAVLANQLPAATALPAESAVPVVLDTHNAEVDRLERKTAAAPAPLRPLLRAQVRAAARLERSLADRADSVVVVSTGDAEAWRRSGARRIEVVPNGYPSASRRRAVREGPANPIRLLFLGSLDYSANRTALREFGRRWAPALGMPWVLDVVGSGRADRATERMLQADSRIRLVGRVEDVQTAYASHDLLVIPIQEGGGTRLKVLEAIDASLPILSTAVGVEGLELVPGEHYLRAEDGETASAQLLGVLQDPERLLRVATAARQKVEGLDWSTIGSRLQSLLSERAAASSVN